MQFKRTSLLGGTSLLLVVLQSACTAVLTISSLRVAIGLTALAAASGVYAPARGFHQDHIRIPMLWIGAVGALVNLGVLAWKWKLRTAPAAQWRRQPLQQREKASNILQVVLAVSTLVLIGLEVWTHPMIHKTGPPPASAQRGGKALASASLPARSNPTLRQDDGGVVR